MAFSFRQIQYFVAVAENGAVSRAAHELATSQATVTEVRPPVVIRTRSVEAARSLVATGAGVAILPDLAYRPWSLEGDKIEARDLVEDLPPVEVAIAWRRGSPLSSIAAHFVTVAQAYRNGRGR
jgi:DNA-binding transcriptional LysR family regulator